MTAPVIEVSGLVAGYGDRPVLRDVSLTVWQGEAVALLGANGSGKSTLVQTALGRLPPHRGQVRLFGIPVARFRRRYRVGYVPQRVGAGGGVPATVREVVASGRLARRGLLHPPHAGDRDAVAGAIAEVGLSDRAGDPVAALSGGQQQRVLIARALAAKPELLVLDEPTAGVDAQSQRTFAGTLRTFLDRGGTVLLVAHELGPLEPLVGRAVVLHQGRVVHDGGVPRPADHHADPAHDHVHPHAPEQPPGLWDGDTRS